MSMASRMINARAETLSEKPSFRESLRKKRCLVPADGFYEWKQVDKKKHPMRITLPEGRPFALAGLWESWVAPEGRFIDTFTIITTEPNAALSGIHNRMPVILANGSLQRQWLEGRENAESVLRPYDGELVIYEVSRSVNSPHVDNPLCIVPLALG
jgi:putative SOS response-associated peptidase YedK